MENRDMTACSRIVDYLTEEMSDVERKRFERHLDACAACREDAAEWSVIWGRLSEEAPETEVPPDLKNEVMDSIFARPLHQAEPERSSYQPVRYGKLIRRFVYAAALALAFLAGFGWRELLPPSDTPATQQAAVGTTRIEQLFRLAPAALPDKYAVGKNAYGVACLIRSDGEPQLVVYVFGSPKTEGSEAYHVWLLKDGVRSSAGTFTVNESGIGLLTVPWSDQSPAFDQVGVTLEPNAQTTSPQGPKMYGSV